MGGGDSVVGSVTDLVGWALGGGAGAGGKDAADGADRDSAASQKQRKKKKGEEEEAKKKWRKGAAGGAVAASPYWRSSRRGDLAWQQDRALDGGGDEEVVMRVEVLCGQEQPSDGACSLPGVGFRFIRCVRSAPGDGEGEDGEEDGEGGGGEDCRVVYEGDI